MITLAGLVLALAPFGCKSSAKVTGSINERTIKQGANAESNEVDKPDPAPMEPETVSVPGAISGALLTCRAIEKSEAVIVDVGCRFERNKVHVTVASIGEATFSYAAPATDAIKIAVLPGDENYDAIYEFSGANFAALNAAANALHYTVALKNLKSGEADQDINFTGNQLVAPPVVRWVREATTDTNKNGICDGAEACIYTGNNLMWFHDTGATSGHVEATRDICPTINSAFSGWRLPMVKEVKMAFEKNIFDLAAADKLNIADVNYWTGESPIPPVENNIYAVNYKSGVVVQMNLFVANRFMCVRSLP